MKLEPDSLIYRLLGPGGKSERLLAEAVRIAGEQLFLQGIPLDEIHLSNHVYPMVAARFSMREAAVSRAIARAAGRCWKQGDPAVLERVTGRRASFPITPKEMIFYLACYSYFGKPASDVRTFSAVKR